jgi:hypothetical protein
MTDIADDMSGVVGSGLIMGMGAVTIGAVGSMMLDASNKMSNKKRKRKKNIMSIPKINI